MSAAFVASLLTALAAPAAFASTSVVSAGTIARGTTSATAASFTFTENSKAALTAAMITAGGTLVVNIAPASPGAGSVTFSGTPVVTAPGSLGASAALTGASQLTITLTGQDPLNVEQVTVSGLKITASSGATLGAIVATLGTQAGNVNSAFVPGTVTATGVLQAALGTAAATVSVNVTSACGFDNTNANGGANFSDVSDARNITSGSGTGLQNIGFALGTSAHGIGTTVTQTVPNCTATGLASPGTVADVVIQDVPSGAASVNPGENNQIVANTTVTEKTAGYIGVGSMTFTLSPAGVKFSASPTVGVTTGDLVAGTVCNVSFDRTSCTVPVTSVSTTASTVTLSNIHLDVDASVANGASVNLTVTASPAINVSVTDQTIAIASRIIIGVAAAPSIWINYNDQSTGTISLTEQGAGFFTGGLGGNNTFGVCITTSESFTRAPYAVVTTGDLKLLNGVVGGASVLGTLSGSCAYWTVYSASTVASTIEIRGSDASGAVLPAGALNGPRLSVPNSLAPGATQMSIRVGPFGGTTQVGLVTNAVRSYKSGVVVAALSQPSIAPGTTGPAGNIAMSETLNGQFKATETITCDLLKPATNYNQQTYLATATSNGLPVVSTNTASGLIAHLSDWWTTGFDITVDQQAFAPALGVITVSNLNYTNVSGAILGPVTVECSHGSSNDGGGAGQAFDAFVSNAVIGNASSSFMFNVTGTALGNTLTGPFTPATKISHGGYITWRFDGGAAAAGKTIQIWAYKKTARFTNPWSAPYLLTTRVANANGVAFANITSHSVIWLSVRPVLPASGSTPAVWGPWSIGRWVH